MENFILNLLDGTVQIDFQLILRVLFLSVGAFWVFVLAWVWTDSGERTANSYARIGYLLLVLVFNILGWIIYLIIRPEETLEQAYWSDLERRYLQYETAELGDCSECGRQIFPDFIFCPDCGLELKVECPGCNVYVDKKFQYCPLCRTKSNKIVTENTVNHAVEINEATEIVGSDIAVVIGGRIVSVYDDFKTNLGKRLRKNVEVQESVKAEKKSKPKKKKSKKK